MSKNSKRGKRNRKNRNKKAAKDLQLQVYFAFGSNVDPRQMVDRCPSAVPMAAATLDGWRLEFAGWSRGWGGAVANIDLDPKASCPGVVWVMSAADLKTLDRFEGHPFSYRRQPVTVDMNGRKVEAWTYIMDYVWQVGFPSASYIERITYGYDRFGLDATHLWEAIGNVEPAEDLEAAISREDERRWGYLMEDHWSAPAAAKPAVKAAGSGFSSRVEGSAATFIDRANRDDRDGPLFSADVMTEVERQNDEFTYVSDEEYDTRTGGLADEDSFNGFEPAYREVETRTTEDVLDDPFGVCDNPGELVSLLDDGWDDASDEEYADTLIAAARSMRS